MPDEDATEPEATLPDRTIWRAETEAGKTLEVTVLGANGRVSWGGGTHRSAGEVRIYRTQTAKHYDAVLTGVTRIWSHNVQVHDLGLTRDMEEAERKAQERKDARMTRAIEAVLSGKDPIAVTSPWAEEEEVEPE